MSTAHTAGTPHDAHHHRDTYSVSRCVADDLHACGTKVNERTQEFGADNQGKVREPNSGNSRIARDKPGAVVGGSVARIPQQCFHLALLSHAAETGHVR